MNKIIFLVMFLLIFPAITSAHGLVTTMTQQSGPYTLEFEYNTMGNILAGDVTLYDVYLLDAGNQPVGFDSAYINISTPSGTPVLAGNLQQLVQGSTRMLGSINEPGDYKSHVEISRGGSVIAQADYTFKVDPAINAKTDSGNSNSSKKNFVLAGVVGILIGFVLASFFKKKSTA